MCVKIHALLIWNYINKIHYGFKRAKIMFIRYYINKKHSLFLMTKKHIIYKKNIYDILNEQNLY